MIASTITPPVCLGDDAQLLDWAGLLVSRAQARGAITTGRAALSGGEEIVIAQDEAGARLGFAVFYEPEHASERGRLMWLDILFVSRIARGNGVGLALMQAVMAEARARGCDRVELGTNVTNTIMQRLCLKAGLVADGIIYKARLT